MEIYIAVPGTEFNNNLRIFAAYGILINYYTRKCTTNYMSVVNKT